jgi:hypothetical protein
MAASLANNKSAYTQSRANYEKIVAAQQAASAAIEREKPLNVAASKPLAAAEIQVQLLAGPENSNRTKFGN